jgi:hypothetical protein
MPLSWYIGTNMSITVATSTLSDTEFLVALDRCEIPLDQFRHGDHLRLAWLELHSKPFPFALNSVRAKIHRFASHHAKAHIYHETITTAWVALLASHDEPSFAEFLSANQYRLSAALLHRFWSPGALASDVARAEWLPPDRQPLPIEFAPLQKRN